MNVKINQETVPVVNEIIQKLCESNLVYSVEVLGNFWDVYKFTRYGQKGTIALRKMEEDGMEIGMIEMRDLDEEEVIRYLKVEAPN